MLHYIKLVGEAGKDRSHSRLEEANSKACMRKWETQGLK